MRRWMSFLAPCSPITIWGEWHHFCVSLCRQSSLLYQISRCQNADEVVANASRVRLEFRSDSDVIHPCCESQLLQVKWLAVYFFHNRQSSLFSRILKTSDCEIYFSDSQAYFLVYFGCCRSCAAGTHLRWLVSYNYDQPLYMSKVD